MPRPPLADVQDLEEWLGRDLEGTELVRAAAVIDGASLAVRTETRRPWLVDADDGAAPDGLTPPITAEALDDARQVVVQCAARAIENPEGAVQRARGPFSASFGPDAAQVVFLTEQEKAALAPWRRAAAKPGLFTLATTRGDDMLCARPRPATLPVEPAGKPMPWGPGL